jgi:hypothetical protein
MKKKKIEIDESKLIKSEPIMIKEGGCVFPLILLILIPLLYFI